MQTKNILIVGVGGQGTLLASKLMGSVLMGEGYDVKVSEVHGMSQRGGSVVTYVRYGERVDSPLTTRGEADLILAFEQLEAARWLSHLKPGGEMIVNTQKMNPMPVISGQATYPEKITETLRENGITVTAVNALALAEAANNPRGVNVALLGVLARRMDIVQEVWLETIRATVPPKTIDGNIAAFQGGWAV